MIEAKRTVEDVEALERASWEEEIDAARRGVKADISRKAAAYYLGIHHTNLSKLRTSGTGPASVQARGGVAGAKGRNRTVRYTLADLDAWKEQNTSSSYAEQVLKEQLSDLRVANLVAQLKLQLAASEAEARALREKLKKHSLAFDAHDIFQPSEWVMTPDGEVLGHLLTIGDEALIAAIAEDRIDELSPADALQRPWADIDQQMVFADLIKKALADEMAAITQHVEAGTLRRSLFAAVNGESP
ncbi:helix-turn-helix transcriptional regulator [Pseudoxanthomonas mexicana]